MDDLARLATAVVDAAVKLHIRLGPGLLEGVYEALLAKELGRRGLAVERQKVVSVELDGIRFDRAFRIDLLVDGCLLVEVKSVEVLQAVHWKQVLTYLRLLNLRLGLLLNFRDATLAIKRVLNGYDPPGTAWCRRPAVGEPRPGVYQKDGISPTRHRQFAPAPDFALSCSCEVNVQSPPKPAVRETGRRPEASGADPPSPRRSGSRSVGRR